MFRNATNAVGPIVEVNNLVLPLWLVIFGIALARERVAPGPSKVRGFERPMEDKD